VDGGAARTGRYRRLLTEALTRSDVMLAEAIDRVKTSKEERPLIAVGGGSILVPDRIPGISEVIRPEHFDAANAVGAAIASVSGQVDRIFHVGEAGRQAVLDEARDEARERPVAAGADPATVQIVQLEAMRLASRPPPACTAGGAVARLRAACGGGSSSSAPQRAASQVFTYDTTATVMDDGWDPATEYSDGIIAMSQMYETLTRYDAATHRVEPLLA